MSSRTVYAVACPDCGEGTVERHGQGTRWLRAAVGVAICLATVGMLVLFAPSARAHVTDLRETAEILKLQSESMRAELDAAKERQEELERSGDGETYEEYQARLETLSYKDRAVAREQYGREQQAMYERLKRELDRQMAWSRRRAALGRATLENRQQLRKWSNAVKAVWGLGIVFVIVGAWLVRSATGRHCVHCETPG